ASSSAPQIAYAQMDQQSSEYSPTEAGLIVPVFQKGDDPIDAINHMMSFLTSVCTKPRRKRDAEWFKDKVLLVQAQANGQVLQEEELEFLADPAKITLTANLSHYGLDNLTETQVVTCTKINQDNKQVNDLLTAELERYKRQERVLNELK
nr:hypothetical protein [Tanacetum cinerariifolium]